MSDNRPARRRNGASGGFTLIEILISLVVLAIGCMAVIAMQTSTLEGGARSYNLTVATFLAESEIERLQSLGRGELLSETSPAVFQMTRVGTVCPTPPGGEVCYTRTVTITPQYPTSNSVGLSVRVDFPGPGGGADNNLVYDTFVTFMDF